MFENDYLWFDYHFDYLCSGSGSDIYSSRGDNIQIVVSWLLIVLYLHIFTFAVYLSSRTIL